MLASFSVVPIGVGEELKTQVAEVVGLIRDSGLAYRLGAMQTTVEGEPDAVFARQGLNRDMETLLKSGIFQRRLHNKDEIISAWTEIRAGSVARLRSLAKVPLSDTKAPAG